MLFDMGTLVDLKKMSFFVCDAHTSCHMAILCQSIFQFIADHHISVSIRGIFILCQEIICHLKCMASIIVICIDYNEWSVDFIDTA